VNRFPLFFAARTTSGAWQRGHGKSSGTGAVRRHVGYWEQE
jgi:hypothetical protein